MKDPLFNDHKFFFYDEINQLNLYLIKIYDYNN